MDFETLTSQTQRRSEQAERLRAGSLFQENAARTQQLQASLPTNRDLINKIHTFGFQKI
jgi:hypothetical protein